MNRPLPQVIPDLTNLFADHVDILLRRYRRLLNESGYDALAIHSGSFIKKSIFDDQYWPHRVSPSFQHWLPLNEHDCVLLITGSGKPILYRNVELDFWHGMPESSSEHFWDQFEVIEFTVEIEVVAALKKFSNLAFVGEDSSLATPGSAFNPANMLAKLDSIRSTKTDYEVACIAKANRRALVGHDAVEQHFQTTDCSEFDLHLKYLEATNQDDSQTPYKNIVALGDHAAILHHVHYDRSIKSGAQSLLIDAGATCLGYQSDITRTSAKGDGDLADTFKALIVAVDSIQQTICEQVKVGLPYEQLHDESHYLIASVLSDFSISSASVDELVSSGASRTFMPHGLGHSIGLQTHDVGCSVIKPRPENKYLRNTSVIEVGQVFTIEPGIYFIDFLLSELNETPIGKTLNTALIQGLRPFGGIRVEDNLAVTADGVKNLTRAS